MQWGIYNLRGPQDKDQKEHRHLRNGNPERKRGEPIQDHHILLKNKGENHTLPLIQSQVLQRGQNRFPHNPINLLGCGHCDLMMKGTSAQHG